MLYILEFEIWVLSFLTLTLIYIIYCIIVCFFKCGLILTHYNCNCIPVRSTLKMATWVPSTCQWLPYNTITFIHSSAYVGIFKNCMHLLNAWNIEHTKLMNPCLSSLYPSHYTDYFLVKDFIVIFWQLELWCFISFHVYEHTCTHLFTEFYNFLFVCTVPCNFKNQINK